MQYGGSPRLLVIGLSLGIVFTGIWLLLQDAKRMLRFEMTPGAVRSHIWSMHNESTSVTLSDDYRHRPDIIFYNRIRKTGSETTSKLFQEMSRRWRFSLVWDWKRPTRTLYMYDNSEEYMNFTTRVFRHGTERPLLFVKHMYYIDFSRFHPGPIPLFMNIIRDPIDRKISEYNYMRYRKDRPHTMNAKVRSMTMDECIQIKHPECYSKKEAMVLTPIFCGYDPVCRSNSTVAMRMAQRNIERNFVTVGTLERMRDTMAVLECALPKYFKGLLYQYDAWRLKKKTVMNRTRRVTTPGNHTMSILRQWLSREYDLADWIRQRFDTQVRRFKVSCPELKWNI